MKKHQQKIEMILDTKKIEYEKIDIAADADAKEKMREVVGDPKAIPPQLTNDDTYCGVSLLQEVKTVCAFQIKCKTTSFYIQESWRNYQMINEQ